MQKHFPGFYPLEEVRIKDLTKEATIVLNSDVLLDLFRLRPEDAACFVSLLKSEAIRDKLWMPYDIAWLYHKKVDEEIQRQIDHINSVLSHLSACGEAVKACKSFPYLKEKLIDDLQFVTRRVTETCQEETDSLSENLKSSEIKNSLRELFEGKIGETYSEGELENIYQEGEERYKNAEPPGYESEDTPEKRIRYHDIIIWEQMLAYAQNEENKCKGILFVTGQARSDWYYVVNGKVISTRHELINEFMQKVNETRSNADKFFYCMSSKRLVEIIGSEYRVVHPGLVHLKEILQEEIVYASLNADGMQNNQTVIPVRNE